MARLASRAVAGVFAGLPEAARAVEALRPLRVAAEQVSVLAVVGDGEGSRGGPDAAPALLGLAVGWVGALRSSRAPGLGTLAGAGALLDEVAAGGDLVVALAGLGLTGEAARGGAARLRAGQALVVVGVPDRQVAVAVAGALRRAGALEAAYYPGRPYGTAYHGAGPGA